MLMHLPIPGYIDPGSGYVLVGGLGALLAVLASVVGLLLLRAMAFLRAVIVVWRRMGRWAVTLVCAGALLGVAPKGGALMHLEHPVAGRVVILGMDGMSPDILEPLLAAGALPHFAALRDQGGYRRLATTNPPQSPVAWAGFATGQNPGKHGLYDFVRRDPRTYALSLSTATMVGGTFQPVITGKRFWSYAGELGVESAILACPVTFPAEPIRGRMLSGMGVPDILGTEGTFTYYTSAAIDGVDTGGRVVQVPYATSLTTELFGPRRATGGGSEQTTVPLLIRLDPDRHTVQLELHGNPRVTLRPGEWSDWQSVTFSPGLFRKVKGILQFYLVEAAPELKLYASPINFDPRDPAFPIASPPGYAKALAERVGLFYTQGMPADTWSVNEGRLGYAPFLDRVRRMTETRAKMLDLELARVTRGIVFAYFDAADVVQHMCWRFTDPASPRYAPDDPHRAAISDTYRRMDALLGRVTAQLQPDDTLLVLSDHGFGPFRRAAHLNAWLRDHGYLALQDGLDSGGDLLRDVDWTRTRAYAIGFGAIYLNLRGREGRGIVHPGAEADALTAELIARLAAWRDGETPVVRRAYAGSAIFHGPRAAEAPDLVVGFQRGYRASWETALGAAPRETLADNEKAWSGDHLVDPALVPGILFANRPIAADAPTLYDLAPTILRALGVDAASLRGGDFDGTPLW